MNKTDLVDILASKLDLSKAKASEALDVVFSEITSTLKKGKEVSFVGFGSFKTRVRAARKGRNPKTGEEIKIKASKSVGFKAGKTLKDAVN